MTKAKRDLFDEGLQSAASYFKVLSHPARLAILIYLARTKSCISGDISNELPLGRTTVYQHLKELKALDLIMGEIEGVKVNYCLNSEKLIQMQKVFDSFLKEIKCCEPLCS